jgi:hypothetical protein
MFQSLSETRNNNFKTSKGKTFDEVQQTRQLGRRLDVEIVVCVWIGGLTDVRRSIYV